MSDPALIFVGVGLEYDGGICSQLQEWKTAGLVANNGRYTAESKRPDSLMVTTAGYDSHERGPRLLVGESITETWNDAIELTSIMQVRIDAMKAKVRRLLNREPSIFFIGQQT